MLAIFYRESCLAFYTKTTHTHARTIVHTPTACSVTRRKETQGEAAHLTGIQLSVSNGGHPGEEEGEADLQWWRRAEGNFLRELVPTLSRSLSLRQTAKSRYSSSLCSCSPSSLSLWINDWIIIAFSVEFSFINIQNLPCLLLFKLLYSVSDHTDAFILTLLMVLWFKKTAWLLVLALIVSIFVLIRGGFKVIFFSALFPVLFSFWSLRVIFS